MFQVNEDLSIYVTRGDAVSFTVTAQENNHAFRFPAGSVVRLKVFEKKDCGCVVLQKDFPVETERCNVEISLTEKETRFGTVINKPTDYWYEIELDPLTNPKTMIGYDDDGAKVFRLFPAGKDVEGETLPEEIPVVDKELDLDSQRPVENQAIAREFAQVKDTIQKNKDAALALSGGIMGGSINMGGNKITNVAQPTADADAATKGFVDASIEESASKLSESIVQTGEEITTYVNEKMQAESLMVAQEIDATMDYAKRSAPFNFLDNSNFRQMVNQYGTENATGAGYHIDRWYSNHSFMSVSPVSHTYNNGSIVNLLGIGNMNLEGVSTQNAILSQQIEPVKSKYMRGRTFTFAVKKLDGTVVVCSGVCSRGNAPENATEEDLIQFSAEVNSGYLAGIDVYKNPETNNFEARIKVSPGGQVYLLWAALYEGEYTVDTLPAYQPKGYAAELLECRRYYYILSNSIKSGILSENSNGDALIRLGVPLPVTMRATPTMTILTASGLRMVVGSNEEPEVLSSEVYLYDDCSIRVDLWIKPYLGTIYNTPIAMYFSAILDANL